MWGQEQKMGCLIRCWFMFPFCAFPISSFEITSVRAGDGSRSSAWLPCSWHRWSRTPEWINYYLVTRLTTWEAACQFGKVTKRELRNWGNWALHLCHTRLVLSIDTLGNGNHLVRLEMEMGWTFFSGAWNSLILSWIVSAICYVGAFFVWQSQKDSVCVFDDWKELVSFLTTRNVRMKALVHNLS